MITKNVINMKIYKITCCDMCPKIGTVHDIEGSYKYCNLQHARLNINTFNTLPKWCTLPDYKEKDNADNHR